MIPIDIQVSMSKVKVKGNVGTCNQYIVQQIIQQYFAPGASNLEG